MSSGIVNIYSTLLRTDLAVMLQYRVAVIIWLLGLVLQPVIFLVVWLTVAESRGGQVGDFDKSALAAYYIVLMLVNHLTFDWHMFEMGWRVRSGAFSPILLQPLHPIHRDISNNIAYKVITLLVVAPATAFLIWYFEPSFGGAPWTAVTFVPAVILAFLVRFMVEWTVALLAFWVTDTSGLNQLYQVPLTLLSGMVAPLALMPEWIRIIGDVLPYRWMIAFPVELLLGRLSVAEAISGFTAQIAWLLIALTILKLTWQRASKRYSAVGA